MTQTIPIADVIIIRDARQRRELEGIPELAESLRLNGQINPITLDDNNGLIAGERRLSAAKLLGWTEIKFTRLSSLSAEERERIELAENLERLDLPWRDRCSAITRYHKLRKEAGLNDTDIAAELNMSRASMANYIIVQREIESGNELVAQADKFSVARNVADRVVKRKQDAEFEAIAQSIGAPAPSATSVPVAPLPTPETPFLNVDFSEWAPHYTGPRFNFLHCDFPYGVNADKHNQGAAKYFRGYADSPDVYWTLIATLGDNMNRLVAESAHMIFWYSLDYHSETLQALTQMGWRVNPFPLVWFKNDNTGILPDPKRGPRRVYETAFFCSIGDRLIAQPVANCYPAPVTKNVHMSEKNLQMLKHFFRMTVDAQTVMFDPTCGSGNALIAAEALGAKSVCGLERDPEFHDRAVAHYLSLTRGTLL